MSASSLPDTQNAPNRPVAWGAGILLVAWVAGMLASCSGQNGPEHQYGAAANAEVRSAAAPLTGEIPVAGPDMQLPPLFEGAEVATGSSGNFVVTWRGTSAEGDGVHAAVFDEDGMPVRDQFLVEADAADPVVGMDAGGRFVVAWRVVQGSSVEIRYQRFDAMGMPVDAVRSATRLPGLLQIGPLPDALLLQLIANEGPARPTIAMNSDGDFVIGWWRFLEARAGTTLGMIGGPGITGPGIVYARAFYADGTPKRVPAVVATQPSLFTVDPLPRIAMNDSGTFTVVWRQFDALLAGGGELQMRTYGAQGKAVAPAMPVPGTQESTAVRPDIASDVAGNQVIVWLADSPQRQVQGQRYASDGMPTGSSITVASGVATTPRAAMAPLGEFAVSWARNTFDGQGDFVSHDVFLRCFSSEGVPTNAELPVNIMPLSSAPVSSDTTRPALAFDGFGDLVVVWRRHLDGGQLRARRFSGC